MKKLLAALALLPIALIAVPASASTLVAQPSGNTVAACVGSGGQLDYFQFAPPIPHTCNSGDNLWTWGVTGPAGPSTAGAAGLNVTVVTATGTYDGAATATCPATAPYVIGGGGAVFGVNKTIEGSEPVELNDSSYYNGWTLVPGSPQGESYATVYAICSQ